MSSRILIKFVILMIINCFCKTVHGSTKYDNNNNLSNQCCNEIGRKHAETNNNCIKIFIPKYIGNNTISDRRFCQELASVCCHETLQELYCTTGVQLATSQIIKSSNSAFGTISCDNSAEIENEYVQQCCNICKLTVIDLERSRNAQCNLERFAARLRMTEYFNRTFQQCCKQIQDKLEAFIASDMLVYRRRDKKNGDYCSFNSCKLHQSCIDTDDGPHCICHSGFQLDNRTGECHDINECQLDIHDCPEYLRCDNTFGSYDCIRVQGCGTGYTINADTDECEDIDECSLNRHGCSSVTVCRNTIGSFDCIPLECQPDQKAQNGSCVPKCTPEQVYNQRLEACLPKNPCKKSACEHNCHPSDTANDRMEYYRCSCKAGFRAPLNDSYRCDDVDECRTGTHHCPAQQLCVNTLGSFYCDCPQGYQRNSITGPCTDINECRAPNTCSDGTNCINLLGEHRCIQIDCPRNYYQKATDNSIICVHENTTETNTFGSLSSPEFDKISYLYYSFLSNQAQSPISFYAYRFTSSSWNNHNQQTSFMNTFDRNKHYQKVFYSLKFRNAQFENYFSLRHPKHNEAIVSMIKPIFGPRKNIQFELIITGYRRARLFRHQVVFNINISKYELSQSQHFIINNSSIYL